MTVQATRPSGRTAAATSESGNQGLIKAIAEQVYRTLQGNPTSRIREADVRERWGKKSPEMLDFWSSPAAQRFFASCVRYLDCDPKQNWPDRTFHQVADIALWTQMLVTDGTIAEPKGEWAKAIELALVGIELAPNDTIGKPDEHMQAGANTASYVSYEFPRSLALKVQALIACSSAKGLKIEQVFSNPDAARAATKKFIYGQDPTWFDTAEGRRAFAEALLLTKLSDQSRGKHGQDVRTLAQSSVADGIMLRVYRAEAKKRS